MNLGCKEVSVVQDQVCQYHTERADQSLRLTFGKRNERAIVRCRWKPGGEASFDYASVQETTNYN
jgi:hypothetical protein